MNKRRTKKLRRKKCPRCRSEDRVEWWELTSFSKKDMLGLVVQCKCGYVSKCMKGVDHE